ncbi:MAG: hypothetical protein WD200_05325 [Candidatus Andersenbacteria bacterium]
MAHPSVQERTKIEQNTPRKSNPTVSSGIGIDQGILAVRPQQKPLHQQAPPRHIHPAAQSITARRRSVPEPTPLKQPITHRARPAVQRTQQTVQQHAQQDERFQHELREMEQTDDLREIDDDVEDVSTLLEWRAEEHNHRPKSAKWYAVLAASITVFVVGLALLGNIIGAITVAFAGSMLYYIAQRHPAVFRYRLMTEGIAFNNTLYHYRDLEAFNIVYEPGHTKTVLLRSKHTFTPLLHMEIGDTDPVAIRDIMIEFIHEDQDMTEPLVDIFARRVGF